MELRQDETIRVLCDGKEAFPAILSCIRNAKHSIEINMFIWRGDEIGNVIAREVLSAANRGVKVTIVKDRYGITCEYSEEDQTSLFHETPTAYERATIHILEWLYNRDLFGKEHTGRKDPLAVQLCTHPNITVHCRETRKDHSKFYVFDDRTLIFGGINIEDKENGKDRAGRAYRDFMVQLDGEEYVTAFRNYRRSHVPCDWLAGNNKQASFFDVKESYLNLIQSAEKELTILMAYFSPLLEFVEAIEGALDRGVRTRILIPARANFMDAVNHQTCRILYQYANAHNRDLTVYLSPDMTHTKYLMNEQVINLGSCNITKNAFQELDEMNYIHPNDDSAYAVRARMHAEAILAEARQVKEEQDLAVNRIMLGLEQMVM